jgi:hypothetical protein
MVLLIYHDIFWLDVTVANVLTVTVIDCLKQLFNYICRIIFSELACIINFLEKALSFATFCHEIITLIRLVHFYKLEDVGVVYGLQNFKFIVNPLQEFLPRLFKIL